MDTFCSIFCEDFMKHFTQKGSNRDLCKVHNLNSDKLPQAALLAEAYFDETLLHIQRF